MNNNFDFDLSKITIIQIKPITYYEFIKFDLKNNFLIEIPNIKERRLSSDINNYFNDLYSRIPYHSQR